MSVLDQISAELEGIKAQSLWKTERPILSPQSSHIDVAPGRPVLNFCANNYLGLADNPELIAAAKEVRVLLEELGLASFVKTTGGKGLHVVVPVRRRLEWPETKAFCRSVAEFLVAAAPDRYIATMSKAARKGKIFVDYLRNERGATSIAAYSTRAKPGAPISAPCTWQEVEKREVEPQTFTLKTIADRIESVGDLWADMRKHRYSLRTKIKRVEKEAATPRSS